MSLYVYCAIQLAERDAHVANRVHRRPDHLRFICKCTNLDTGPDVRLDRGSSLANRWLVPRNLQGS